MKSEPIPPQVTHDAGQKRFEIRLEAGTSFLSYSLAGDEAIFDHTFVPEALRGHGLAAVLVRAALAEARRAGWKVVPACSYVATFMERHPEYADLLC